MSDSVGTATSSPHPARPRRNRPPRHKGHLAYLDLAAALLICDLDQALAQAQDILAWDDRTEADRLEAPGVSVTARCSHLLAQGALGQLGNTEQ